MYVKSNGGEGTGSRHCSCASPRDGWGGPSGQRLGPSHGRCRPMCPSSAQCRVRDAHNVERKRCPPPPVAM